MPSETFFPFDSAAHYELLRQRLILYLERRGCTCPEEVVDEAIMRILDGRAPIPSNASLDKWTFGVALRVMQESFRHAQRFPALQNPDTIADPTRLMERLDAEKLLSVLSASQMELLREALIDKVGYRTMARAANLTPSGMRVRVHQLRKRVRAAASAVSPAQNNFAEVCPI